jgi:TonB-dependent starch-binding outer membrane protein SusC
MKEILWQPYAYVKKQFFIFSLLFFSVAAFSPSFTGTVTDADNRPISKVTVQVKGTSRRALNDYAGKFSINASGNNVLFLSSGDDYSNSGDFK